MFDDLIPQQPQYGNEISGIESGGNYNAVGPETGKGRALGKYQVMSFNVGPWTKEALGRELTPTQFMQSPEAQDAVFKHKFGGYVQKYGPEGAARAWFAGEDGMNNPNARDVLGTSVADYSRKFTNAVSSQARQPQPQQPSISFNDLIPAQQPQAQFADRFGGMAPPENQALQTGMNQQARQMQADMRGPAADPLVRQSVEFQNQQIAGGQGTTPIMDLQMKNLITDQVFENDAGLAVFRDPATGQLVEADQNRHVVMRDPQDNRLKVFARAEETNENPAVSGARVLAQGLAAGAPTARAAIPKPTAKETVPRASDIIATSKPHYQAFDRASDAVGAVDVTGYADRIKKAMEAGKVPEHLAKEVYDSVGLLASKVKEPSQAAKLQAEMNWQKLPAPQPDTATLSDLRSLKELIGQSSRSNDSRVRQAAAIASKEINKIIAEVSSEAGQSLKTADEIFSTGKSVQDLQRKEAVADLRAGRAGYGGNAVNSMRQVLSPIVQKAVEGKVTGFKPNEIEAMREIVEGTTTTNLLRGIGQLSPSKGIIQTVGAGGAAYAAGPVALAVPAIGVASNKLATILTGNQIDRLKELVAKRSPAYAEAVQKAIERYEKAQMELVNQPGPNKLAAYVSASRQLANGLSRDGISVTSADLMRSIQGPVRSAADDEQPKPEGVVNQ